MKLNYQTVESGKNMVLLHGWGMGSKVWEMVVGDLAKKFRVTTLDLPGYGANKNFLSDHTLPSIGEKIAIVIPEKSIVVGWSMGGLVAMWLAIYYPRLVDKLIITNSSPCFVEKDNWPGINKEVLNYFKNNLCKDLNGTMDRFASLQVGMTSGYRMRKQLRYLKKIMCSVDCSIDILVRGLDILINDDLRMELVAIKAPMFWLLSEHDRLIPASIRGVLKLYANNPPVRLLKNSDHVPFISNPKKFLDIVFDFIYG